MNEYVVIVHITMVFIMMSNVENNEKVNLI